MSEFWVGGPEWCWCRGGAGDSHAGYAVMIACLSHTARNRSSEQSKNFLFTDGLIP